jgi:peroxiredoxin
VKNPITKFSSDRLYSYFLHTAVLVLAGLVIYLAVENRQLKGGGKAIPAAEVGDKISFGNLESVGESYSIAVNQRQVLLFFSTTCPFCLKSVEGWNKLDSLAGIKGIAVVGISFAPLKETHDFVQKNRIAFHTFVSLQPEKFKELNHIRGVPCTIIRSADSNIEKIWWGPIDEQKMREVVNSL